MPKTRYLVTCKGFATATHKGDDYEVVKGLLRIIEKTPGYQYTTRTVVIYNNWDSMEVEHE